MPSTFFGNPALSRTEADVEAFDSILDHHFSLSLRNHLRGYLAMEPLW